MMTNLRNVFRERRETKPSEEWVSEMINEQATNQNEEQVMKSLTLSVAVLLGLALAAAPASAQVGKGLSGPHYNLTIIGVPKNKTVSMDNTNGHTLFVPLDTNGLVSKSVKISYVIGDDFQVLDRNCTDADGCTIQVPTDPTNSTCYTVVAVGLGKPNGFAVVNVECAFDTTLVGGGTCTDALVENTFEIDRTTGGSNKPHRVDITKDFLVSGCFDVGGVVGVCDAGDIQFTNVWIFNLSQFQDYFWNYDNTGLKNMQIRFYPSTDCGTICTVGVNCPT